MIFVHPYIQLWRNIARGLIDSLMALQFCLLIYLGYISDSISDDNIDVYNGLGWFLLSVNYVFNLYFIVMIFINLY